MALTEKQKTFARALVAGMTQKDAYLQAFDVETVNNQSIIVMASREANKPDVKAYIEKVLKEEQNVLAIMQTKDDAFIRTLIHERMLDCMAQKNDAALSRYAEILNKMNGVYVNITKDISEQDNDISKLSTEELKAFLTKEPAPEVQTSSNYLV